jgi:transcriptional regulator with XRE-family HTH domain
LTQRALGAIVGVSPSEISRIEHGQSPRVAHVTLALIAAALGMDLPLRAFPAGDPLRDAPQLALLARFRARFPRLRHVPEVPLGIPGDRRAWDEMVLGANWSMPLEAESRIRDLQALERRLALKLRDGGRNRVILLVADTRHNRHVLHVARDSLAPLFPANRRDAMAALDAGRPPPASVIILL